MCKWGGKANTNYFKIVWERERQEKAVKVWLSDGRIETFGNPCFTSLSLWGNRAGTRLGAIKFKTKQGGEFFAKMTSWGLKTEYPIDIGSGFCHFVIFPYTGTVKITFQSTVLTDVNYPTINQIKPQVTVEEIKSVTYTNYQQQKIKTSKKLIKKIFMATIAEVVEFSSGYSFKTGSQSTYSLEETYERTKTLATTVEIPPGKKVDVDITISRATSDLPYTGTVKITCKNGSVLQYETKGQNKGITYTDIKVNAKELVCNLKKNPSWLSLTNFTSNVSIFQLLYDLFEISSFVPFQMSICSIF
uniref:Uncharacterized protein n=1 Tax=Cyprinus carpio TaxID=7962 RepID=A0A8C2AT48_CYPCA